MRTIVLSIVAMAIASGVCLADTHTYYVRPDGSNAANGTSYATGWLTLKYALLDVGALGDPGDTVVVNVADNATQHVFTESMFLMGSNQTGRHYIVRRDPVNAVGAVTWAGGNASQLFGTNGMTTGSITVQNINLVPGTKTDRIIYMANTANVSIEIDNATITMVDNATNGIIYSQTVTDATRTFILDGVTLTGSNGNKDAARSVAKLYAWKSILIQNSTFTTAADNKTDSCAIELGGNTDSLRIRNCVFGIDHPLLLIGGTPAIFELSDSRVTNSGPTNFWTSTAFQNMATKMFLRDSTFRQAGAKGTNYTWQFGSNKNASISNYYAAFAVDNCTFWTSDNVTSVFLGKEVRGGTLSHCTFFCDNTMCSHAVQLAGEANAFIGNTVVNLGNLALFVPGDKNVVEHNSVYSAQGTAMLEGIPATTGWSAPTGNIIRYNIIQSGTTADNTYAFSDYQYNVDRSGVMDSLVDYNCYWGPVGHRLNIDNTVCDTLASAQAAWDTWANNPWINDRHSVIADPQFIDIAGGDLRVRLIGPALKRGYYMGAWMPWWPVDQIGTGRMRRLSLQPFHFGLE